MLGIPLCPGCLRRSAGTVGACARCLHAAVAYPLAGPDLIALGRYHGALAALVRAAKYRPSRALIATLGRRLGEVVRSAFDPHPATLIVWVPPDDGRRARRGVNHARLLAEAVSATTGLAVAPALVRRRRTVPQSHVTKRGREANVAGAIALTPGFVAPRGALLIDDVATTGATLRACRAALGVPVRCAVVAVAAALAPPAFTPPAAPTPTRTTSR